MLLDNERLVYAAVRRFAQRGERPTIAAISEETGVPRSSVAHVAETMGYRGWVDFTTQLVRYFASFQQEDTLGDSVKLVASVLEACSERPVLVDAIGDAEIFAQVGVLRLCEAGFNAMPYGPGVVEARASRSQAGALIVVNESGMSLLPTCLKAAGAGFDIIAITASHDTPVSKLAKVNVVIKNNKSTPDAYEPNYFTAGVFAFMERVFDRVAR